jgi:Na+-translocating ferredoxin:NAD+ oxidoreductase RnfC subunit
VSGKAVKNCGNYLVRIGTMLDDLYSLCGGEVYPLKELEDFKHNAYDCLGELNEMKQDLKNEKDQAKILVLKENIKKKQKDSNSMIFKYLKENQKNFNNVLAKIVNGGSFLGNCLEDFNYTICKPTTAILFMSNSEVNFMESETCIHCGKCQKVCPMKLVPYEIYENKENLELCKKKDVMSCLECGCCSYICPAKLSLTTTFIDIKKQIKQNNSNLTEKKDGNK